MANLNRVFLIGNLTRDPELRYTPGGAAVTSFGLAVNTTIGRPDGQMKEDVCFVKIIVWGKQAESCKQYLVKGRPVCVEGRLMYRSWQQDGKTRSTLEVRADRVQFLGGRREEGAAPVAAAATPPSAGGEAELTENAGVEEPGGEGAGGEEPPF
jgi:single-strand DNA-binding protein